VRCASAIVAGAEDVGQLLASVLGMQAWDALFRRPASGRIDGAVRYKLSELRRRCWRRPPAAFQVRRGFGYHSWAGNLARSRSSTGRRSPRTRVVAVVGSFGQTTTALRARIRRTSKPSYRHCIPPYNALAAQFSGIAPAPVALPAHSSCFTPSPDSSRPS
jgi:hypothetical protein